MKKLKVLVGIVIAGLISLSSAGQTGSVQEDLTKAQALYKEGKAEEATRIYLDLMGKYPRNREAVQGWLIVNMKRSSTGELDAVKQLEELEKTYPENTGILFYKTFIQAEYDQVDDMLKNSEKLVNVEPQDGLNWLMRGQVLEAVDRNDEALSAYRKSTDLSPENPDSWQIKAGLLSKTGKFDEAISDYDRAIELSPEQPFFIYNRGCCYSLKGNKEKALADLQKAVTIRPDLKAHAIKDADFKSLWDDPDFKKITGQ
ncbi:MAG TPA: tetratricopeptide repeat protein [Bacteroidales bacterium]|jgi:tetratricopeptide (TPR) repeat protein|nr:tetratricopeptide repeat protein [Bacteroidales bacterium]